MLTTFLRTRLRASLALLTLCGCLQFPPAALNAQTTLPTLELPPQDNAALRAEELAARAASELRGTRPRPPHFATSLMVDVDLQKDSRWETLPDGHLQGTMRIRSAGAHSLNFGFTEYELPPGAALTLTTADGKDEIGPFTPADNETHQQLWTPVIFGDDVLLRITLPAQARPDLRLRLRYVNHDFMDIGAQTRAASFACNVDVVCGAQDSLGIIDAYRDAIRSVGMYHLNGIATCSGALINTPRFDCRPYFLTADHCGIDSSNVATMVVYWNFQNSWCRPPGSMASEQPGDGQLNQFSSGASFLSHWWDTDFALVELDDPIDKDYEPHFAGWSISPALPDSAFQVSHPNSEEKRITMEFDSVYRGLFWPNVLDTTHIVIHDPEHGTSQPGSSGSPLFNPRQQIIGQLSGGGISCFTPIDLAFGNLSISWDGNGTLNSRLRDWLDPDNTGLLAIEGRNCFHELEVLPSFQAVCATATDTARYRIAVSDSLQAPATLSFRYGSLPLSAVATISPTVVPPGDTADLVITNLGGLAVGTYQPRIHGTDGTTQDSVRFELHIDQGLVAGPTLINPMNGATGEFLYPTYVWSGTTGNYDIEIATDAQFQNIVDFAYGRPAALYKGQLLAGNTLHYWRVRQNNSCGTGPWSGAASFTTSPIVCQTVTANNLPMVYDSFFTSTLLANFDVNFGGDVVDVNVVEIAGTHTSLSDLRFQLISPSITRVLLLDQACGPATSFSVGFDDQAAAFPPCPYDVGGQYWPIDSLTAYIGEPATGGWILRADDLVGGNGGTLDAVTLELCVTGFIAGTPPPEAGIGLTLYPNPSAGRLNLRRGDVLSEATISVYQPDGTRLRQGIWPMGESEQVLDLGELPNGLYLVRVSTADQVETRRALLQR